uniref:Non-heme iron oxygenase ferredoxin subunit n=1 Tax=uncultured Thiotrichaceae bacterium TaxID=298394 RepID=A0A6S6TVH1_9GAMM|nr:MAG: Non-heme iron oxygenase ferredoxin subunit [uncultured Thiotrichaceae bacterium]
MIDAGTIDDIKLGKMKRVDTGTGKRVLVCNVDGEFFAVDDMCTHEDASLWLGCLKGAEVQCSLHGGMFNVKTGEATVEPAEIALNTYPVSIADNRILVDYPEV